MMNLQDVMQSLPETDNNVLSVMSGGLDSGIMTMILTKKYGSDRVFSLSYDYGQKQKIELSKAKQLCEKLNVSHKILDLSILGEIAKPISSNITGSSINVPNIKEILGDPQPKTYVPFRNLILLSLTLAQAEASNCSYIFTGLQITDEYGYWDTTQKFVDSVNNIANQNRTHKVEVRAPFSGLNKHQEINICRELDMLDLLQYTLTCYNPDEYGRSCGKCPSCSERIQNFAKSGIVDPIEYSIDIPWSNLIERLHV